MKELLHKIAFVYFVYVDHWSFYIRKNTKYHNFFLNKYHKRFWKIVILALSLKNYILFLNSYPNVKIVEMVSPGYKVNFLRYLIFSYKNIRFTLSWPILGIHARLLNLVFNFYV